jgi:hypothetical protein
MPARRFPPPWSILVQPLSERQRNVRRAAAIFSFSLHPLAKKISAKNFCTPRNLRRKEERPMICTRLSMLSAIALIVAMIFNCGVTVAGPTQTSDRNPTEVSPTLRKIMHVRSIATLCLFGLAALVALKYPLVGLGICICCLIGYLKPDPPEAAKQVRP